MNSLRKMLVLLLSVSCVYASDQVIKNPVTPGAYQPRHMLPGCDKTKLAKLLTDACNKQHGDTAVNWQANRLSQAICLGEEPIVGQDIVYSMSGNEQPCPGSQGNLMSSKTVCEVNIDSQYRVNVIAIYSATCSG